MDFETDKSAAIERARAALEAALAEPGRSVHRIDLTNALNYLETIARQSAVSAPVRLVA